jgi:hypothetical protein
MITGMIALPDVSVVMSIAQLASAQRMSSAPRPTGLCAPLGTPLGAPSTAIRETKNTSIGTRMATPAWSGELDRLPGDIEVVDVELAERREAGGS